MERGQSERAGKKKEEEKEKAGVVPASFCENMHHSMLCHAQDHGILRDIFFGARQLMKILSNSWQ